jgi:vacuolar-type H+-ATPase subunit I/STV1
MATERPLSALPSPLARILAFVSILVGGVAGALIGYALVDIQAENASDVALGIGLLVGAIVTAGGTAIVAILVLRAIGEWRTINDRTS